MKMVHKILVYSHSFAPVIGGAESYAMLLAQGLTRLSSSLPENRLVVTVATPTPAGNFDDSGLTFEVVREPNFVTLTKLVLEADVIHLCGACFKPLLLGWLFQKPVVIEHHGYTACCPNGLLLYEPTQSVCAGHFMAGRYRECLKCNSSTEGRLRSFRVLLSSFPRRWLSKRAAANVPITRHVLKRISLPNSTVIYYGVPDSGLASCAPTLDRPSLNSPCFAYVGRLVPLKGLPILLKATRLLKDKGYHFRLKLLGDGPERESLGALVTDLKLGGVVEFTGFSQGEQFSKELDEVSVVVMPSIWEETAGLAAIEQMMRGRLVIASDIGGLAEVVGDAGLKCPPGDPVALANCMKRVLDNPEIAVQMGRSARARALSEFGEERMAKDHAELFLKIIRSR